MATKYTIFDRFADSLEKCCPQYQGRYGCPLTMSLFQRASLNDGNLTLEHCIPARLGKNVYVLTAKSANNNAGSDIDSHLHRMIRQDEFFREGIGSLRVRIEMGDASVGADFTRSVDDFGVKSDFKISKDRSDPKQLKASQEWAKRITSKDNMPLNLHPNDTVDRQLARIALLKAGYLLLFHEFGYTYILDSALNPVRNQISSPYERVLPLDKVVYEMKPEEYRDQILLVQEPEELSAYIIGIKLRKNRQATPRYFGVVLPASVSCYGNWRNAEPQKLRLALVSTNVDYIENPRPFLCE